MDTLDFLKNNVLGITEKAIIEVIDLRNRKVDELDPVEVKAGTNQAGQRAVIDDQEVYADAGWVQEAIDRVDGKPPSIAGDFRGAVPKYFRVQFNPNTLRLTGHSGGLVKKTTYKQKDDDRFPGAGGIEYGPGKTYLDMNVSLLFDKVDAQDAFLEDKLATSLTNIGTGVVKAAITAAGIKKNSVQPEVEGFIAALRDEKTRLITFHWGEFNYSGKLRNVNAVYSMFNPNGQPIRATVDLTMTCADSELSKKSIIAWNEIYYKSFKDGSESFVQVSQKAQSLVNI